MTAGAGEQAGTLGTSTKGGDVRGVAGAAWGRVAISFGTRFAFYELIARFKVMIRN
jgi:hypothetical protein